MGFLDEIGSSAEPRAEETGRGRRRIWLVLLGLLVLVAAGYVGLHRYATGRVPLGTSVEGVDIAGLDAAVAATRLSDELGSRLRRPVTVTHDDQGYRFDAARAGMRLDIAGTLRAAGIDQPRWSPVALWHFLTGHGDVPAAVTVDAQRFTDALDALTARIGQPLVEGDVRFVDGHARAVIGQAGLAVDHARTQALVARLAFEGHPGELPLTTRRPYVDPSAVRRALREIAQPAMAAPVVIDLGGHRVRVPPAVLGQALDMVPSQRHLVLLVEADRLADLVVVRDRTLGPKPVDATVRLRQGSPVVVPAVDGITFDHQQLATGLPAVLRRPPGRRTLMVHAVLRHPPRSTAAVRAWRIASMLASVPVTGPGVSAAVSAGGLDGAVVAPGSTLHLADRLGRTSAALATALFTAALQAGLEITASTVPSSYDDRLPAGLQRTDVTIAAPADTGLLVSLSTVGSRTRLVLWGAGAPQVRIDVGRRRDVVAPPVRTSEATACVPHAGIAGFAVTVRRRVQGRPAERFESRYAPVPAVTCAPPPSPSGSPSASPSG